MVTHTLSGLRVLTLTSALAALLASGCAVPTVVGSQNTSLADVTPSSLAFHQAPDEETLHFVISTFAPTCANPGLGATSTGTCPAGWTVTFALPAASQVPGTYALSDPSFQSSATQSLGSDGSSGGCIGGGGGGIDGTTAEVVSIDASHVKVRLSGYDGDTDLPAVDGEYDVSICK